MPKSSLFWQVYERLVDDTSAATRTKRLVEGAFAGEGAIEHVLGESEQELGGESSAVDENVVPSRAVYLERLEVAGFRGIGAATKIEFEPCPGLTVIVGRNGSGKSSLAEALEVLLTGNSLRWKDRRQKEWLSGWKNLHHQGKTWVRGTFLVEGTGESLQVQRKWEGTDFEAGALNVEAANELQVAAWEDALDTFRPILSHNEIGGALDEGPSHLYDLLRGILGLEELTVARERLAGVRKRLQAGDKRQKELKVALERALEKSEDPRVLRARDAISGRKPDLDVLTELVVDEVAGEDEIASLRRLATVQLPSGDDVLAAAQALREAADRVDGAQETFAALEGKAVELLRQALDYHAHDIGDSNCPVCGTTGVLTDAWRASAGERVETFGAATAAAKAAAQSMQAANRAAAALIGRVPALQGDTLESLRPARVAQARWAELPEEPRARADHLEHAFDGVETTYRVVRGEAETALQSLQAHWRPIRRSIEEYLEAVESWERARKDIAALKDAEAWLGEADEVLRAERFAPIRARAQAIWEVLRHRSNVHLNDIRLEGNRTRRRVELDVAVDGEAAVALGVMSQGELHCMLLSLFLPRLTLAESPFRFLIVDDPIQAMDPAKVDGLAQVLSDVATTRQVVVFTHDARLPEALRRMQLPVRIVEVARGERSAMTLRTTQSRPKQFLADAWQVADSTSDYGPRVAPAVVPGLCRGALEAWFQSKAWEMLLREGKEHDEIERAVQGAKTVHDLAALALFGDAGKSRDVYSYLNNKAPGGTDTFIRLKDGAHGEFQGDVRVLIKDTQKLLLQLGAEL